MLFHIPFITSSASRSRWDLLSPSVLWFLFGVLVAASGVMLGMSLDITTTQDMPWNSNFYYLMSQVFITVFSCYCTLAPVLHAHLKGTVDLQINLVVFYLTVTTALCTAVAAPVVHVVHGREYGNASNILSFVSSVLSVITASQLAAGVLKLGK